MLSIMLKRVVEVLACRERQTGWGGPRYPAASK
jgi:hypothetical protein